MNDVEVVTRNRRIVYFVRPLPSPVSFVTVTTGEIYRAHHGPDIIASGVTLQPLAPASCACSSTRLRAKRELRLSPTRFVKNNLSLSRSHDSLIFLTNENYTATYIFIILIY